MTSDTACRLRMTSSCATPVCHSRSGLDSEDTRKIIRPSPSRPGLPISGRWQRCPVAGQNKREKPKLTWCIADQALEGIRGKNDRFQHFPCRIHVLITTDEVISLIGYRTRKQVGIPGVTLEIQFFQYWNQEDIPVEESFPFLDD